MARPKGLARGLRVPLTALALFLAPWGEGVARAQGEEAQGAPTGMFQEPAQDLVEDDPSAPAGTLRVQLLDGEDKPYGKGTVSLGIVQNSVAKGESRRHLAKETDDAGGVSFDGLETANIFAYRVTVVKDGATFAAMPFNLSTSQGKRVKLHVYPVTGNVERALVVMETFLFVDLKDDRVQLEQLFRVYNFGKVAWVPNDLVMKLPETFTGFSTQQAMSDVGVDQVAGKGIRLRGTFSPGRHEITYRWQLPFANEPNVRFNVGLPPNVAAMRVLAAASDQMRLVVDGFPEAELQNDVQGQRILATQKQAKRDGPQLQDVRVSLENIPVPGPARFIATGLTILVLAAGLVLATTGPRASGASASRRRDSALRDILLADLEDLERAYRAGDIGPKTYQRARRDLVDALAQTLATPTATASSPSA